MTVPTVDRGLRDGALLVDRDGRRQAVDLVDVGLLHLAQELARVGGQALDVAALALGVDRVEGEAGLAAAGEPGDDDEPVARQLDGDVLEVVFARAANDELVLGHVVAKCSARWTKENRRSSQLRPLCVSRTLATRPTRSAPRLVGLVHETQRTDRWRDESVHLAQGTDRRVPDLSLACIWCKAGARGPEASLAGACGRIAVSNGHPGWAHPMDGG